MQQDFSAWIGRSAVAQDRLEPARSRALSAALGRAPEPTDSRLPLLHHWLYFWDVRPPQGLGTDGHPARGDFLPPVPLPRRMWAGGRLRFHRDLKFESNLTRTSTILKVETKSGRSGDLVFVTVRHEIGDEAGVALTEEQDIVYRGAASATLELPKPLEQPPASAWRQNVSPDPVLLFRYSALTMNGHRIHYDRTYAMKEEAYPGLVVQGPLQATLLIGLAAAHLDAPIAGFEFRGLAPAYDGIPLHVCGDPTETGARLWIQQGEAKSMSAQVVCGDPG